MIVSNDYLLRNHSKPRFRINIVKYDVTWGWMTTAIAKVDGHIEIRQISPQIIRSTSVSSKVDGINVMYLEGVKKMYK